jgi:hypothetical protein
MHVSKIFFVKRKVECVERNATQRRHPMFNTPRILICGHIFKYNFWSVCGKKHI